MVEILWNSESPHTPVKDHEFYELRMVDMGTAATPRFLVRQIHCFWSASSQQIRWDGYNDETCGTTEDAWQRFNRRKASIRHAGFSYSSVVG